MQIDLWADITCPWCYLSVRHLRQVISESEFSSNVYVRIHSFYLDPELDSVWEKSHAHYMTNMHDAEYSEVTALYDRLEKLGQAEGVTFNFDRLTVAPPTTAFAAVNFAREEDHYNDKLAGADTYHLRLWEAIARAHFELGLNIADPEVILGCAQDIGLSPRETLSAVQDPSYTEEALADYHSALAIGITAVPTMLIDNQYIIPEMQSRTALTNILTTAWKASHEGSKQ